jgi:hypothetical protein
MQYSAILREIDAELNKLLQVRNILAGTVESSPLIDSIRPKKRSAKRISSVPPKPARPMESATLSMSIRLIPTTSDGAVSIPRPIVTVLPPKQKREYRRTIKPFVPESRALAAPRSSEVVVYMAPTISPKTVSTAPSRPLASPENLEAVMRQKLFGGTRASGGK